MKGKENVAMVGIDVIWREIEKLDALETQRTLNKNTHRSVTQIDRDIQKAKDRLQEMARQQLLDWIPRVEWKKITPLLYEHVYAGLGRPFAMEVLLKLRDRYPRERKYSTLELGPGAVFTFPNIGRVYISITSKTPVESSENGVIIKLPSGKDLILQLGVAHA